MQITIDITQLGPKEERQARYLAALAQYRALAARFAESGQADQEELRAAAGEVARWEPTAEEMMCPIREVVEMTGVSARTIRRWVAEGQAAAEKRGKLWYVDPRDVELLVAVEEPRVGRPLGARKREEKVG